jgi:hypothetical protein
MTGAGQLRFNAPAAGEAPMRLRYTLPAVTDSTVDRNAIPPDARELVLPTPIVVQGPPDITWPGQTLTADIGANFPVLVVQNGQATIKGRWLRKSGVPSLTFSGAALTVLQHSYEANGSLTSLAGSGQGADRLVFTAPTTKSTGWLTVSHPLGRDSALVTVSPPPVVNEVRAQVGASSAVLAAGQSLQRGGTYILRGQHLSITHTTSAGTSIKRGVPRLGSIDIVPTFASDTNIIFTVPATFAAASAALQAVTAAGTATVGVFPIVNAVANIAVSSVSPSSLTIISGQQALLSATLNIPANTPPSALGVLRVLLPPGATNALTVRDAGYPVDGKAPTEIKVTAADLLVATPLTMTVFHESNPGGQGPGTRPVSVIVRPPHPVAFKDTSRLTAGTTSTLDVRLDAATRASSPLFVQLASSNPNAVPVPPTATMSGDNARFTVSLPPTAGPTTATLSASVDGVTISQPFAVVMPVPISLTTSATTVQPGARLRVSATFSGNVYATHTPRFDVGDTALRVDQTSWQRTANTVSADVWVAARQSLARALPISITYGGVTLTRSVNLELPTITSWTSTPAAGRSGETLQATAVLSGSSSVSGQYTVSVASGDTNYATIEPYNTVVAGTSKVVVIRLRGTPTTPRPVPITATFKSDGVILSTRTLVVTVNP